MILKEEREQIVEYGKRLVELGLTVGTFGNLSVYDPAERLMAISPSGMDYFRIRPEDVVVLTPEGEKVDGDARPSSECDMHRIFYQRRPDVRAVIHTHSIYATTLACLHWSIEPVHYAIAYGGADVPCIPYVPFGTWELAEAAFEAMGESRNACLLGNHGLLAVGSSLPWALDVAEQMEFVSRLTYQTRLAGGGVNLTPGEIADVLTAFQSYRKK